MIPIYLIGVVAFVAAMVTAISSKKAHNIDEKIGEKKSLFSTYVIVLFGMALMTLMIDYIGILFYFVISFALGLINVLINDYMNQRIKTSHRVTILSIKNMGNNLAIFILFPIVGYITKIQNMQNGFLLLTGFLVLFAIVLFFYSRKLK